VEWQICRVTLASEVGCDAVEFLVAQFAEVVLRAIALVHDAHTAAMLPYMTLVTLDEEAASIVCGICQGDIGLVCQRRARIILVATDAASDVVFRLANVSVEAWRTCDYDVVLVVDDLTSAAAGGRQRHSGVGIGTSGMVDRGGQG